ncbi:hypothetical protein MNBD_GAMMA12-2020 [hydrothermal vent metagenome]|uniref:Uncharacterized protein n=1 Tax=hydrothermal vent metagenome TaxID=652676 RepID=A0A3B0XRD9_9ZZZZ
MRNLIFIILLVASNTALSSSWISPIDNKYQKQAPALFEKFKTARELLNSYRGRQAKLYEAGKLLKEILYVAPEFAPAFREFGRLFIMGGHVNYDNFMKGSLASAESAILESIRIEPEYADSFVLLGHLYTKMNRISKARAALIKAEKIGTNIPWLHLNWADLLKKEGKYEDAMKRYQLIVNKGSSNRKAYSNALSGVTTMYMYFGQYSKANEGYKKEIEYEPESAWNWGNYADFLLYTYKDADGAIDKGRKALSIMNYGMGRFTLACALYTKWAQSLQEPNKKIEAEKYLKEAWLLYPFPNEVIAKTIINEYTRIAATELIKWLKAQSS